MVVDPLPPDAGRTDARPDYMVVDPLPPDAGRPAARPEFMVVDPLPPDAGRPDARPDLMGIDPLPPDAGRPDTRPDYMIADMLPRDSGPVDSGASRDAVKPERPPVVDPAPAPGGALSSTRDELPPAEVGAHWTDTTPRRSPRARDLPLCLPPEVRVEGEWVDGAVRVRLTGADEPLTIRWQSEGEVTGTDRQVTWTPSSDADQLNVAVRSRDGVAVAELRLNQVCGRRG